MKKTLLGMGLAFALGFPAFAQDKQQDRVKMPERSCRKFSILPTVFLRAFSTKPTAWSYTF
jgi:hypothetical protein